MKTLQTPETENTLNKNEMNQVKGGDNTTAKNNSCNIDDDDPIIILP